MPDFRRTRLARIALIVTLVVAGEMVFALPFHTNRFFRPTFLEVFGLSNTELGDVFAAYGFVAMLAYFPGGALADRYPARWLLTASLLATAAGGLFMATIPGPHALAALYAYWGFTSIFLFWGALIRATRDWGGPTEQGRAFGLLEGGRGLVAASVAGCLVLVLAALMPDDPNLATAMERRAALQAVILLYAAGTALAAVLAWYCIPLPTDPDSIDPHPVHGMRVVVGRPVVWVQAFVVVCAYCGYKGLDNYSLYAVQVLGMDEVDASSFATLGAFVRPVAAIAAGIVADRYSSTRACGVLFALLVIAYCLLSLVAPPGASTWLAIASMLVTYAAVYALRGVYFALLEENRTPRRYTGAAVGLVSLLGFTPDFFFGPVTGRILDAAPGLPGHQHYFAFLAAVAVAGLLGVAGLLYLHRNRGRPLWPDAAPTPPPGVRR